jgi:hypothetical protein
MYSFLLFNYEYRTDMTSIFVVHLTSMLTNGKSIDDHIDVNLSEIFVTILNAIEIEMKGNETDTHTRQDRKTSSDRTYCTCY